MILGFPKYKTQGEILMQYQRNQRFVPASRKRGMYDCNPYQQSARGESEPPCERLEGSDSDSVRPESEKSLAMFYSPYQSFDMLFDYSSALCKGTIFKELDKPFLSKGCGCR